MESQSTEVKMKGQVIDPMKLQDLLDGKPISGENNKTLNHFLAERAQKNEEGDVVSVTLGEGYTINVGDEVTYGFEQKEERMQVKEFPVLRHLVGDAENPPMLFIRLTPLENNVDVQGPLSLVKIPEEFRHK